MMTVFHGIFLGYILGALATMICIWLAGGSLYGSEMDETETEEEDDGKERDKNKA